MRIRIWCIAAFGIVLFAGCAAIRSTPTPEPDGLLTGDAFVSVLRQGGCVIVMRHASSPHETPDKGEAAPGNEKCERQLDAAGRANATAMGKALRDLKIPIGEVMVSPTYRVLETATFAQLPNPRPHDELGDRGHSMQGVSEADAAWLRNQAATRGVGNTFIVTHGPNMARAFPGVAEISSGEALVFRPDGKGAAALIARITITDWANLE